MKLEFEITGGKLIISLVDEDKSDVSQIKIPIDKLLDEACGEMQDVDIDEMVKKLSVENLY